MEIIAKITHPYGRKQRRPGDKYDATAAHAKFLVKHGMAAYPAPAVKAAPAVATKDMAAQSAHPDEVAEAKRSYKRKDMTAEESKQ